MKENATQLPLGVHLQEELAFDSFYSFEHEEVMLALKAFSQGVGELFIYLWGAQGVGKTHLLQAVCRQANLSSRCAMYVDLSDLSFMKTNCLKGLEKLDLVCLDNLDNIVGKADWEEAIFHFFNLMRDNHARLLVCSKLPAAELNVNLPDLKSRLSWGVTYYLNELSDEGKTKALQLKAYSKGIHLATHAAQYLIRHCARNMHDLLDNLDILDKASLSEKRAITIPLIKNALNLESELLR